MRRVALSAICVGLMLMCASVARADWSPGDPYKMHFPQLPDPQGWDVNMTWPKVLADDWQCTQTGPVDDVHFWFSWRQDQPAPIESIHVSIHSNIPQGPGGFSIPGALLWERDFTPTAPNVVIRQYGSGPQGWYDPNTGVAIRPDHFGIWQANITNIPAPFFQQVGEIYWLDLSVRLLGTTEPRIGWKTSLNHFMDDAVWSDLIGPMPPWRELRDPFTSQSLDLAFVITPEPASLAFLALVGVIGLRRR